MLKIFFLIIVIALALSLIILRTIFKIVMYRALFSELQKKLSEEIFYPEDLS